MKVQLMHNASENFVVNKTTIDIGEEIEGTLRETCSVSDPVIKMQLDLTTFVEANYCYIDEFKRCYYITDIVSIRDDLIELHLHVDVLNSFQLDIANSEGIVKRNTDLYNLYINDNQFKLYQNPTIVSYKFPAGFSTPEFVLAVAGN